VARIPISEARKFLAEIANQAKYQSKITILTKHGEEVAAVAPLSALKDPPDSGNKKRVSSARVSSRKIVNSSQQ
jgi:antitoxin (DNA-binding transcriptional repressor) of toxin-antitoxin stability system